MLATAVMLLGVAAPVGAQDENPETTVPAASDAPAESAPTEPPVTPVPNDPLVNEGASESLDPNTVDPDAEALPGTGVEDGEAGETVPCQPADLLKAGANVDGSGEPSCGPGKTGRYANQPAFVADQLRSSEVRRVRRAIETATTEHVQNVATVRSFRLRRKSLDIQRDLLSEETRETIELLEETEEQMRRRALATFVGGDNFELSPTLDHDDILQYQQKKFLVGEVLAIDQDLLDDYTRLRNRLEAETLGLYERIFAVRGWLASAEKMAAESAAEVDTLQFELDTWNYLSAVWIPEVEFPIHGDYEFPLINSWGYPRAPGTVDQHWHEGIDIFAPTGSPLVAAEGGEITDIGVGTLGGLKIWILGDSGTRWYYAHLDSFNPELSEGDSVKAGDLIGYVGASGNAVGTPPHLHLQMHPKAGRPVNPYPILQAASDRYQAELPLLAESGAKVSEPVSTESVTNRIARINGLDPAQVAGASTVDPFRPPADLAG